VLDRKNAELSGKQAARERADTSNIGSVGAPMAGSIIEVRLPRPELPACLLWPGAPARRAGCRALAARAGSPARRPGRPPPQVAVKPGAPVKAGQQLVVMSAMKMETAVCAPVAGIVTQVRARRRPPAGRLPRPAGPRVVRFLPHRLLAWLTPHLLYPSPSPSPGGCGEGRQPGGRRPDRGHRPDRGPAGLAERLARSRTRQAGRPGLSGGSSSGQGWPAGQGARVSLERAAG
jgi:biotin carboxyl carrier protein